MAKEKWLSLDDYAVVYDLIPLESNSHTRLRGEDPARLLVSSGVIARPWVGNPATGEAFVWPVGVEGFDLATTSTLGIHHYIGEADLDATVVYPEEFRITLSGTFPGTRAAKNETNLRNVLRQMPPDNGFVLSVPQGIISEFSRVKVESSRFSHSADDNTHSIGYEVTFLQVGRQGKNTDTSKLGSGSTTSGVAKNSPTKKKGKGKSTFIIPATGGGGSLRTFSLDAYGNADVGVLKLIDANEDVLRDLGIQPFEAMYKGLPPGTRLVIPE